MLANDVANGAVVTVSEQEIGFYADEWSDAVLLYKISAVVECRSTNQISGLELSVI